MTSCQLECVLSNCWGLFCLTQLGYSYLEIIIKYRKWLRCLKFFMYNVFGLVTISETTKILSKTIKLVCKSGILSVKKIGDNKWNEKLFWNYCYTSATYKNVRQLSWIYFIRIFFLFQRHSKDVWVFNVFDTSSINPKISLVIRTGFRLGDLSTNRKTPHNNLSHQLKKSRTNW